MLQNFLKELMDWLLCGNVWEWIDDQQNDNSLTAGASWWYGGSKTTKQGAQYKPSDFFAIYVGFRCAYD